MKRLGLFLLIAQIYALTWVLADLFGSHFCHNSSVVKNLVVSRGQAWIPSCYSPFPGSWQNVGSGAKKWLQQVESLSDFSQFGGILGEWSSVDLLINEWEEIDPEVSFDQVYLSQETLFQKKKVELALLEALVLQRLKFRSSTVWSRALAQLLMWKQKGKGGPSTHFSYGPTERAVAQWIWQYQKDFDWMQSNQFLEDLLKSGDLETILSFDGLEYGESLFVVYLDTLNWLVGDVVKRITPLNLDEHHKTMKAIRDGHALERKRGFVVLFEAPIGLAFEEIDVLPRRNSGKVLVKRGRKFVTIDGYYYGSDLDDAPKAKYSVHVKCGWPLLDEVFAGHFSASKRIFVNYCSKDFEKIYWQSLLNSNVAKFLADNYKTPFIMYHTSSLRWIQHHRNWSMKLAGSPKELAKRVGWKKVVNDEKTTALRPWSNVEAVVLFRDHISL